MTTRLGEGEFVYEVAVDWGELPDRAPHGLATDSRGDVYVAEVSYGAWAGTFPGTERPLQVRSLRKLKKA